MYAADHIIDMGPGPGMHGGYVVAQGTVEDIKRCGNSQTGLYLSRKKKIGIPDKRRKPNNKWVRIIGARENNLKNIIGETPGVFTSVTGVSFGQSSLM